MNFKRFHESKNLTTLTEVTHDGYVKILTPANSHLFDNIEYDTEYTLSWEITSTSTSAVYNQIRFLRSNSTSVKEINNGDSFTLTSTEMSEIVSIAFYFGRNNTNGRMYNIMLNSGSTPLPYEPYSSEVWHDIPHYIHNTSTDTITTLPADIYANDTTVTVGLKGNMSQTGTPTPQNPIQPSECGERTGNLFDKDTATIYEATIASNGSWTTGNGATVRIPVMPSTTYTLHTNSLQSVFRATEITSDTLPPVGGNLIIRSSNINSYTFTTSENAKYVVFQGAIDTVQQWIQELMLNTGETALPYEPYGIKIPILSAGQTTPVYLGEVESTRKIRELVLTGQESWESSSTSEQRQVCYLTKDDIKLGVTGKSTHINWKSTYDADEYNRIVVARSGNHTLLYLSLAITYVGSTLATFKQYLQQQYAAGTPVCVWYVLATEETGIVNEPLRKIGDYADEVSGITIPTIAGANTLSVGTTLQPSEVTANFHGWHPVSAVHERINGAWD